MAHRYTVGVEIAGVETEIPTIVPGNEDLQRRVQKYQDGGLKGEKPKPTQEELDRAIKHFKRQRDRGSGRLGGATAVKVSRAPRLGAGLGTAVR